MKMIIDFISQPIVIAVAVWVLGLCGFFYCLQDENFMKMVDARNGWERTVFLVFVFGIFPMPTISIIIYGLLTGQTY